MPTFAIKLKASIRQLKFVCIASEIRIQHRYLTNLDPSQTIRPMPRARSQVVAIIDQLAIIRANIESLNQSLAAQVSRTVNSH